MNEMQASNLQALAAPLIGIHSPILAFRSSRQILILLNPKNVRAKEFELVLQEKCMSSPYLSRATWRPTNMEIQFSTITGATHTMSANGASAQLLAQHIEYLTGPMPQAKMTKYEMLLAYFAHYGVPIPQIIRDMYQATTSLRALPGEIALMKGSEEYGYQAVWKNERILNIFQIVNKKRNLLHYFDTRSPLDTTLDIERRLMSCLSITQRSHPKILLAGLEDIFLHYKISRTFPNFRIQVVEEDGEKLSFSLCFSGQSSHQFETSAQPLAVILQNAQKSKLDVVISSNKNNNFSIADEKSLESSVIMVSKSLTSDGLFLLRVHSPNSARKNLCNIFLKVFPKVYAVKSVDGYIIIGARSPLDLDSWKEKAYGAFAQPSADTQFAPDLCCFEAIERSI